MLKMDEKKEEKIVKESQKEEIKTDTEKTERSRNRITKIKQIKVKKGIRNAVIVVIAIIAIFIAMLILDKSQHTFNGQVLKLVGITEKKQEDEGPIRSETNQRQEWEGTNGRRGHQRKMEGILH